MRKFDTISDEITVKPVYNEQVSAKVSFRYNQSFNKEMYAIGENDVLSYNRMSYKRV